MGIGKIRIPKFEVEISSSFEGQMFETLQALSFEHFRGFEFWILIRVWDFGLFSILSFQVPLLRYARAHECAVANRREDYRSGKSL